MSAESEQFIGGLSNSNCFIALCFNQFIGTELLRSMILHEQSILKYIFITLLPKKNKNRLYLNKM